MTRSPTRPARPDTRGPGRQLANVRDLGGLATRHGTVLRSGQLLRSDAPQPGDDPPAGLAWPPRTVLDLRSFGEWPGPHPLTASGTDVVHVPLLEDVAPQRLARQRITLAELYLQMLHQSRAELARIAGIVADAPGPTLIHCAAGKDRTGVALAFLLCLLGIDRRQIVTDYQATRANLAPLLVRLGRAAGTVRVIYPEQLPRHLLDTPTDAIDAVLDHWAAHPGGVAGWARDGGLSDRQRADLRRRLVHRN